MSDPWEDEDLPVSTLDRGMTPEEVSLADKVYAAIQHASNSSERAQQAGSFTIGVSDVGTCHEYVRRMFDEIPEPVVGDKLEAFIGTALGDHVERAVHTVYPDMIVQATVSTIIEGDGGRYMLYGHPDLIDPAGVVIDGKTVDGLETVRRTGPTDQQLFQRHIYAKAAHEAGLFGDLPLDQVRTANVWIDRSGRTKELLAHMDDYNPAIVTAAGLWLDDVVYAHQNHQPARKDPPRQWCQKVCGHFADCRLFDTDVDGLITDEQTLVAIDMHQEGLALEKEGKRLKKEASSVLEGVHGNSRSHQVRWIHVNPSDVSYTRRGYDRLSITPIK